MNKDLTLVILAAGMGSRFGGLKQIEPVGPNGEFIIDYSIYDAVKAGFNKVVFIIKEENYETFKETVGKRVEPFIKVEYAFQKNDNLKDYNIPKDRIKPFGTAHALLCAKDKVNESFAIISSDDFYGSDAFTKCADYLRNNNSFCVIGYKIGETLSTKGSVKRGVCMESNGYLTDVIESKVEKVNDRIECTPLDESKEKFYVEEDHPVSMIMFGLTPSIFNELEKELPEFFSKNKDNLDTCEYLLPDVIGNMIEEGKAKVKVIPTVAKWHGITYRDDLDELKKSINTLIEDGTYPEEIDSKKLVKKI